jgi:SPP1 family predicted phage head-tail adaptor
MQAGQLNRRIFITQPPTAQDSAGQVSGVWPVFKTLWASVNPVSGREFVQGAQTESQITMTFEVRHITTITTDMRVQFDGKTWLIQSIIQPDDDHRRTQLMCREL